MAGREVVKNIKPVFCRFDMDKDQERRTWQIIQKLSKGQGEGKRLKYNDIIAKAVVEYYDRAGQMPMKNEELLEKIGEIIDKKLEQSQKDIFRFPFFSIFLHIPGCDGCIRTEPGADTAGNDTTENRRTE